MIIIVGQPQFLLSPPYLD